MRTPEEVAEIKRVIRHERRYRMLELWVRLHAVGDIPPMSPQHALEVMWALVCARDGLDEARPLGPPEPVGVTLRGKIKLRGRGPIANS